MNTALSQEYTAPIGNLDPEEFLRWRAGREQAYNVYMRSLDVHEKVAYFQAHREVDGTLQSLELHLHDEFVAGKIETDTIGAEILVLLGEL